MVRLFFVMCFLIWHNAWSQNQVSSIQLNALSGSKQIGLDFSYTSEWFLYNQHVIGICAGAEYVVQKLRSPSITNSQFSFQYTYYKPERANLAVNVGFTLHPHRKVLLGVTHNIWLMPFGYRLSGTFYDEYADSANSFPAQGGISTITYGPFEVSSVQQYHYFLRYSPNKHWGMNAGILRSHYYYLLHYYFKTERETSIEDIQHQYYLGVSYSF